MSALTEYLQKNAVTLNASDDPADADVIFFSVKKGPDASKEGLLQAIAQHPGEFNSVDPLDGKEHSYIELGGWLGDQGLALTFIGLGATLGAWKLLTPRTMLGSLVDEGTVQQMAGMGLVSMQVGV